MKRVKWEEAMAAYDYLDEFYDLEYTSNGQIVRQYLEQPHWTFTAGIVFGLALGILASVLWGLLA